MNDVNETIARDPSLRRRLAVAIDAYRAERDSLESIDDRGNPPGGGPDRVKCVHAHAAHELVSKVNPVGALALHEAGWPDCSQPCFEVRSS